MLKKVIVYSQNNMIKKIPTKSGLFDVGLYQKEYKKQFKPQTEKRVIIGELNTTLNSFNVDEFRKSSLNKSGVII